VTVWAPLRLSFAVLVAASLLAGCQSAPPAAATGKTVTVGDTTITTSGRVFVEGTNVR
jgi:uncharacterized lipoprotein YajG